MSVLSFFLFFYSSSDLTKPLSLASTSNIILCFSSYFLLASSYIFHFICLFLKLAIHCLQMCFFLTVCIPPHPCIQLTLHPPLHLWLNVYFGRHHCYCHCLLFILLLHLSLFIYFCLFLPIPLLQYTRFYPHDTTCN